MPKKQDNPPHKLIVAVTLSEDTLAILKREGALRERSRSWLVDYAVRMFWGKGKEKKRAKTLADSGSDTDSSHGV